MAGRTAGPLEPTLNVWWPLAIPVKYWHFVDVAWVFIYPTLYLIG